MHLREPCALSSHSLRISALTQLETKPKSYHRTLCLGLSAVSSFPEWNRLGKFLANRGCRSVTQRLRRVLSNTNVASER
jgi:hypothetical protein